MKKLNNIHNKTTLDESFFLKTVSIVNFINVLLVNFSFFIHNRLCFYKSTNSGFTRYPHKLLLLLLINKLNIINIKEGELI